MVRWRARCLRAWCFRVPGACALVPAGPVPVAPGAYGPGACGPGCWRAWCAGAAAAGPPQWLGHGGQRPRRAGARGTAETLCGVTANGRACPPQAADDGQHPASAPGVGPGDRDARIGERGPHLLVLGVARHRPADLRQGGDRGTDAHGISHARSRAGTGRLDADRGGAADQVRGALLVSPGLAEVDRMPVIPHAPAGITVQPVNWPARRDPEGVPGETDHLDTGVAGLRREVHRGRPRPRVGRGKCRESRISKSHNQGKGDYPTHLHPPNAIAPATAGGRRQAFRLSVPCAFRRQAHRR